MHEKDVVIFNNTWFSCVFLKQRKTGAEIEVFLLRELNKDQRLWDVLVDPARKIRIGNKLYFGENDALVAEVIDNTTSRGRTLRLCDGTYEDFKATLYRLGEMPIPKWIRKHADPIDTERYQSVFAKIEGSIAAGRCTTLRENAKAHGNQGSTNYRNHTAYGNGAFQGC